MREDNLNGSPPRELSTPMRQRLVDSIKKSIHRSMEKIDPADYKNILKGENIFMHLSYKGDIINSEYTKVAMFMGAAVYKKALEKITCIITNDTSNRNVKKLVSMGKPALSVLWLEACFQERRRVPYDEFLFRAEGRDQEAEAGDDEQKVVKFEVLMPEYQQKKMNLVRQFDKNNSSGFIRFTEKKQKVSLLEWTLLPAREIELGQQRRKSQTINEKMAKKLVKSKTSAKSMFGVTDRVSNSTDNEDENDSLNNEDDRSKNKSELGDAAIKQRKSTDLLFEKYLKDYTEFEKNYEPKVPDFVKSQETPCFMETVAEQDSVGKSKDFGSPMALAIRNSDDELLKTCSIKRESHKKVLNFKLGIPHPMLASRVSKINKIRVAEFLPEIQIASSDVRDLIWLISRKSKYEALFGHLSKAKMFVDEGFVQFLQSNPLIEIEPKLLSQYEVKFKINSNNVRGKRVALLDSVMGSSSLEDIVKFLGGKVLSLSEFLFEKDRTDLVISNKKKFFKSEKESYSVVTEAKFVDMLLSFDE